MNRKHPLSLYGLITVVALATFLALLQAHGATATSDLPPRATAVPDPIAVPDPAPPAPAVPAGGRIQLHAQFSQAWPWDDVHWQSLWTVVQWYDVAGNWHIVDGWQGNLDTIEQEEGGWVGQKEWWAGAEILGTGPYRWVVYHPDGQLLATSGAFALPDVPGGVITVEVLLEP